MTSLKAFPFKSKQIFALACAARSFFPVLSSQSISFELHRSLLVLERLTAVCWCCFSYLSAESSIEDPPPFNSYHRTSMSDDCEAKIQAVINVPLDYEMQLEDGLDATDATAILHGSVDRAIASFANERFVADCSQGILGVRPGYTDFIDMSAATCSLGGNCFPVQGYVIAQYNPDSLTPSEASASVFATIASAMANSVARNGPTSGTQEGISGGEGVIALGMQFESIVGGVRSQEMSNGHPGGIRGLSPGGKFGVSLLFIALFALLVAAAVRRKRRREAWREEKEFDGTSDDHNDLAFDANADTDANADVAATKASMMKEIDDVVAGLDIDSAPTQDTAASADAGAGAEIDAEVQEEQSLASMNKPARYPVDHNGFPSPPNGGEEGFEITMA